MGLPSVFPISIYQGDDFLLSFRLRDELGAYTDLTGWTGRAQLRVIVDGTLIASFTVTINTAATPHEVVVALGNTVTGAIVVPAGVYDVELTNAQGKVRTYLAGVVTIVADITQT